MVADNILIERLPSKARTTLLRQCKRVDFTFGDVLFTGGEKIKYGYFPIIGFVSLMTPLDGKPVLEVGMVGREGMVGALVALGATHDPLHALVQGSGSAWRIDVDAVRRELLNSFELQVAIRGYLNVTMTQLATSAACLRFHHIEPRLARWLLMTQDRMQSERFYFTHEFLSFMLGVRRVGITQAAAALQSKGLIEYSRGNIIIVDRRGLIGAACSCYATDIKSYSQLRSKRK